MKTLQICLNRRYILDKYSSFTIVYLLFFLFVILGLFKEYIFPPYFFGDANTIASFMGLTEHIHFGDSYRETALIYTLFHIERGSLLYHLLSSIYITYVFFRSMTICRNKINIIYLLLFLFFLSLAIIYMTVLSKDFFVFLIFSLLIIFYNKPTFSFCCFLVLSSLYAIVFRTYWFIFIAEFLYILFLLKFTSNIYSFISFILLSLLTMGVVFSLVLGFPLDHFRELVNSFRIDEGIKATNTIILPFFNNDSGNVLLSVFNVIYVLFTFFIPIPLLVLFSPYYIFISVMIFMLLGGFWRSFLIFFKFNSFYINSSSDSRFVMYYIIILAFLITQSLFEPDYGSFIRHLSPLFPIIYICIINTLDIRLFSHKVTHNESFTCSRDDKRWSSHCNGTIDS